MIEIRVAPRDEPWTCKVDPAATVKAAVARFRLRTEEKSGPDDEAISPAIAATEDASHALVLGIAAAKRLGIASFRWGPLMNRDVECLSELAFYRSQIRSNVSVR
jgi:hypothetical protein